MSPKNARLETNGDQNSSTPIRTDATIGFRKVSFQLQSGAEVSASFHLWNKSRRAMDRADCQLVSLSFGNHFVVELLWPLSREESADDNYGGV